MIDDFEVQLDEVKWMYLQEQKGGSLRRAGMAGLNAAGIASRIREKVDDSYIYCLSRATEGDTLKFNVMIEAAPRVRICGAFRIGSAGWSKALFRGRSTRPFDHGR